MLWTKNEECKDIIESLWGIGVDFSTLEGIMENLKHCALKLSSWSSSVYGHIPKKIQSKRNALNNLTQQDKYGDLSAEIWTLRRELNELLEDKELYCGQRAKPRWLKEGDRNTKFFSCLCLRKAKAKYNHGNIGWTRQVVWGEGNLGKYCPGCHGLLWKHLYHCLPHLG